MNGRCFARARLGQLKPALADCDRAIELNKRIAAYWEVRGYVQLRRKAWGAAADDYTSAIIINPKLANAFYGRGVALRRSGQAADGDKDLAEAKALKADVAQVMAKMGVVP